MRFWLSIVAICTAACLGCATQPEDEIPSGLTEAIDAFYASVEAGDTESRIEMFTEDAVMMPNHWTRLEGKAAIAEVFRAGADFVFRLRDREIIDMAASGDLAYTVNSYWYTYHAIGEEPQWHKTKNVHIWKRGADDRWRLHVDIWNSDVPMDSFPNE